MDTRRVLTWEGVEGEKTVKARLVAKGYQEPDLCMGTGDLAGSVSRRASHLRVLSLGAPEKWPLWSLDLTNAFLQADGFYRNAYFRAPRDWNSEDTRRVWKAGRRLMG